MIATKEQEIKALEKIKKIVSDLGEDSYLSAAFDGCFDIAKDNIENDFCTSPEKRFQKVSGENTSLKDKIEKLEAQIQEFKKAEVSEEDRRLCIAVIRNSESYEASNITAYAEEIVKLADRPTSEEFMSAVRRHRASMATLNQLTDLKKRLIGTLKTM